MKSKFPTLDGAMVPYGEWIPIQELLLAGINVSLELPMALDYHIALGAWRMVEGEI